MSLQTNNLSKIQYLPLSSIKRPITPVLDYAKIDAMESTLRGVPTASSTCPNVSEITAGELPPIDVLCVRHEGKTHYFAFGGCHRFQAYDRMQQKEGDETNEKSPVLVRCKVLPATVKQLKLYLGASVESVLNE
ncbi:BA75_05027T0 [Komagataella pastoris]|uniref:Sulfiredoxin n=1 Tax=Komagataella pastoris TaxID=4922 RepID=A0A1B2JHV8_PICPA|nr:BA75_05027T0 [Komagataella pastoris]